MIETYKEVHGTFDGENMRGEDGNSYVVPANYASKSKLVEGDSLKAYIQADGSIIYKQVKTAPRLRFIGTVLNNMRVVHEGRQYRLLGAVVRYYKLQPGMQVACISSEKSTWCVVESVIEAKPEEKVAN